MSSVVLFVLLSCLATAQGAIKIKAVALGSSQSKVALGKVVTNAIVAIDKTACKKGVVELIAYDEAKKVLKAAAETIAYGQLNIKSSGHAVGKASIDVFAKAIATVIAKAISKAASKVGKETLVKTKIEAIEAHSYLLASKISFKALVKGHAKLDYKVLAEAKKFIQVVAEALAIAAGVCNKKQSAGLVEAALEISDPIKTSKVTAQQSLRKDLGIDSLVKILKDKVSVDILSKKKRKSDYNNGYEDGSGLFGSNVPRDADGNIGDVSSNFQNMIDWLN